MLSVLAVTIPLPLPQEERLPMVLAAPLILKILTIYIFSPLMKTLALNLMKKMSESLQQSVAYNV